MVKPQSQANIMNRPGTIIIINGASSSGKTTIATRLQNLMPQPYLRVGVDTFLEMLDPRYFCGTQGDVGFDLWYEGAKPIFHSGPLGNQLFKTMFRALRTILDNGMSIISDQIISHHTRADFLDILNGTHIIIIELYCPLAVLQERELNRPNRIPGMAQANYEDVYTPGIHDLRVNTQNVDPLASTLLVKKYLESNPQPHAFYQLLQAFQSL